MAPSYSLLASKLSVMAAFGLFIALCFRVNLLDVKDPYRCRALLSEGRWVGHTNPSTGEGRYQHWQPPGCMFHEYIQAEIESCFGCNTLLFIGDSTARQIFWATAKKFNKTWVESTLTTTPKHSNITFSQGCVRAEFMWDPFLNSTSLLIPSSSLYQLPPMVSSTASSPRIDLVLIGVGLWHAKELGQDYLEIFESSVNTIARQVDDGRSRRVSRLVQPPDDSRVVFFAPVVSPKYSELSSSRRATITPEKVGDMNARLKEAASKHEIDVLESFSLMASEGTAFAGDGLHVVDAIAKQQADLLLNLKCNGAPEVQRFPFNKTCCATNPPMRFPRSIIGLIVASIAVVGGCTSCYRACKGIKASKPLLALIVWAATLCYCFVADRTWVFEKVNKVTDRSIFLSMVGLSFVFGTLCMTQSGNSTTFLPREQTEEWKGWMQLVILAYHYTGMSKVLQVYQIIRLLVASYLFMTGFGHFVYFYKTNDISFRRLMCILIRLNILAYGLSVIMSTPYDFYYFPALSSFWFMAIYLTFRVGHWQWTTLFHLAIKTVASTILVAALVHIPGVLEQIFGTLETLFNLNVNVPEFRFRLSLDLYIVPIGMLAAILYLQLSGQAPCPPTCFASTVRKHSSSFHILAVVSSLILLPTYLFLIHHSPDKYAYNRHWHPYLSFIPILSFIYLRNSHPILLTYYSRLFSWIGRISLETFVLQYHIWLAGDTKGLLRLGLLGKDSTNGFFKHHHWTHDWPALVEFLIISVIFLSVSRAVSTATSVLVTWLVGPKNQRSLPKINNTRGDGIPAPTTIIPQSFRRIVSTPAKDLEDWEVKIRVLGLLGVMWMISMLT